MHDRFHSHWMASFSPRTPRGGGPSPLDDPALELVVRLVVSPNGVLRSADVIKKSGQPKLDQSAIDTLWGNAPWRDVPRSALDEDGQAYIEWTMARGGRLCSGLKFVPRIEPPETAVPRLVAAGKNAEAWRWVRDAASNSPERVLTWYARFELQRTLKRAVTPVPAAAALLVAGDATVEPLLRDAVEKGDPGAGLATEALFRCKKPVCPWLSDTVSAGNAAAKEAYAAALLFATDAACTPGLIAVFKNSAAATSVRLAALKVLAGSAAPEAIAVIAEAKKDATPAVKAAALLASVKLNAGRPTVFRVAPFLRDPSVEMRAAAYGAVVRAGGDAVLGELYRLSMESDPRPYEVVAEELAKYASEPTAAVLERMLKKNNPRVRMAVAKALAARGDPFARKLLQALLGSDDPEIRAMAVATIDADRAGTVVMDAATKAEVGYQIYRQLLAQSQRAMAAKWLLARYDGLDPDLATSALVDWLLAPQAH